MKNFDTYSETRIGDLVVAAHQGRQFLAEVVGYTPTFPFCTVVAIDDSVEQAGLVIAPEQVALHTYGGSR